MQDKKDLVETFVVHAWLFRLGQALLLSHGLVDRRKTHLGRTKQWLLNMK
jgi:hypothetical protein